ncbi:hypothetical protein ALP47_04600, partial [Pseudomonas savastanoi]
FALSLILGPMRLARRPASHPPDQRQDSAVTNVALCVVCSIVVEKRLEQFVKGTIQISLSVTSNGLAFDSDSRSHAPRGNAFRDALRHTVLRFSEISARLDSPFRPSATYFDGAKVTKSPRSC